MTVTQNSVAPSPRSWGGETEQTKSVALLNTLGSHAV